MSFMRQNRQIGCPALAKLAPASNTPRVMVRMEPRMDWDLERLARRDPG
jgi:hypothetical protein